METRRKLKPDPVMTLWGRGELSLNEGDRRNDPGRVSPNDSQRDGYSCKQLVSGLCEYGRIFLYGKKKAVE